MLDPTSPPPPPSPQLKPLASPPVPSTAAAEAATVSSSATFSYSPSLLIITAIIILVGLASFAIHLLLRLLPRRHPPQLAHPRSSLSSSSSFRAPGPAAAAPELVSKEKEKKDREAAIESLPVFTLASALAAAPKSAADCAVCLSRFRPHDELRLLPACCHAFHQSCVDVWLRNTPSCPLCRASIYLPAAPPPLQPPPPLPAAPVNSSITTMTSEHHEAARSGSFRIEFGSVSRRRSNTTTSDGEAHPPPAPQGRSYSLGSAYEYLVEEEVEAVVARALRRPISKEQKQEDHDRRQPQPPGSDVAEAAGGGSWLRDYVDRLASSASSSFSSLRFSSRRFGSSVAADEELCDTEENHHRNPTAAAAEDVGVSSVFYKWFMGVH